MKLDADIVIGADGINSKVREFVVDAEPPRFVDAVAHRAIFPTQRLRGFKIPDCTKWWGRDQHILPYFMTSKRDEVYVIGVVPASKWESDAPSVPGSREELVNCFANFHGDLLRVLEAADDVSVWPIFDRERNDCWSRGRVVLLGDACHPMRPFMAAGGAMAVEDAAILTRCLASIDDPAEAFLDAGTDGCGLVLLLRCLSGAAHSPEANRNQETSGCWWRAADHGLPARVIVMSCQPLGFGACSLSTARYAGAQGDV